MSAVGTRKVRRWGIVTATVLGVIAVTAIVVHQLYLNDNANAVDAQKALEKFRAQTTVPSTVPATQVGTGSTTPVAAATPPPLGVYRYTTTGFEHIDVLGGTTHSYPAETTITVTADGCGVLLHWDLLQERNEGWRLCIGPEGVMWQPTGATFYHEFYQHGQLQHLVCDRSALLVPVDGRPRDPVAELCHLDDRLWLPEWKVIDTGTRTVEGTEVHVTHVRMTIKIPPKYYEDSSIDLWLDDHGLPISIVAKRSSKNDSSLIGDVVYNEQVTADLESLTPLR